MRTETLPTLLAVSVALLRVTVTCEALGTLPKFTMYWCVSVPRLPEADPDRSTVPLLVVAVAVILPTGLLALRVLTKVNTRVWFPVGIPPVRHSIVAVPVVVSGRSPGGVKLPCVLRETTSCSAGGDTNLNLPICVFQLALLVAE